MLKKAGIIVATAAAGLLAVSSFAFADETTSSGNQANTCGFDQTAETTSDNSNIAFSLLGAAANAPLGDVVAPVTAQAPIANCNNIGFSDLFDTDSNNDTETTSVTKIKDSNNTED